MCNILFILVFCMASAGMFENAPNSVKVAIAILMLILEIILLYKECQQEELQNRVKILENKIKELVGEDDA